MSEPGESEPRTHAVLFRVADSSIAAVMDCFSGKQLRVFTRCWPVGTTVQLGFCRNATTGDMIIDRQFCVVTGHSHWQTARAMANKAGNRARTARLHPGHWHEVVSE